MSILATAAAKFDSSDAQNFILSFWNAMPSELRTLVTGVGGFLIVMGIWKLLKEKRRGTGGGGQGLLKSGWFWEIVAGVVLIGPTTWVPLGFGLLDLIVNFFVSSFHSGGGTGGGSTGTGGATG